LASLGLGWLGEPFLADMIEPFFALANIGSPVLIDTVSFALAFGTITTLHIVLGELAPKSIAIRKALPTTLWVSTPLRFFYLVFKPAIWLLNGLANCLLKCLFHLNPVAESELAHSEQELQLILDESAKAARISPISQEMMSGPYIQVDETPIKYLDPGNGKTGQGYFWVAHRPGADVLFEWHTTREAKCLQKLIPSDFNGTVQCDGYSAYDYFARHLASEGKPILLAGCWAHTRRGFYEALDHAPKEAGWILIQIGHLYDIERRLRRQRAGRALRDAYRSSQSQPICARIRRVLQRWYITS
jgi:Transposase IS66 family/Cyclin M transmembrane N-terminal domain